MRSMKEPLNRRILVIDDKEAIHADFRKILTSSTKRTAVSESYEALFGETQQVADGPSFEIDSASQGEIGMDLVVQSIKDRKPYAMAFVDMRMPPGWDGIETIEHLWSVDENLMVVICTAYNDYNWKEMSKQLGNMDRWLILKKPFDNLEVRQLAASLTEKWHLAQQARLTMAELEQLVETRTASLQLEILERKECERKLLEARDALEYQATHDPTTGLMNRSALNDALERELSRSQRNVDSFAIMLVDIDHFKQVNDNHGHQTGDTVLKEVAEQLQNSVRPYDIVGRYGGEEFLILLPECCVDEAMDVADRVRRSVSEAIFEIGDTAIPITISLGLTACDGKKPVNVDSLIRHADDALYQAKKNGRNRVIVSEEHASIRQPADTCSPAVCQLSGSQLQ